MKNSTLLILLGFWACATSLQAQSNLRSGIVFEAFFNGHANDTSVSFLNAHVEKAILTADRFGKANSAYAFNGVDALISYPPTAVLNFDNGDAFTLSFHFRSAVNQNTIHSTNCELISKWYQEDGNFSTAETAGYPFVVRIKNQTSSYPGRLTFARYDGSTTYGGCENNPAITSLNGSSNQDSLFNDNEWHHVVIMQEASTRLLRLYIDGQSYGGKPSTVGLGQGCNGTTQILAPMILGARYRGAHHFTGAMDDVQIWNRSLSEAEVMELFQSNPTSVTEVLESSILWGPNPASGILTFNSSRYALNHIALYELTGRKIDCEIDMENHSANLRTNYRGIAMMLIHTDQGILCKKVLFK